MGQSWQRETANKSACVIACIIGTRPEVIKMAPIVKRLRETGWATVKIIATGQQDRLLADALAEFSLSADFSIPHRKTCATPAMSLSALVLELDKLLEDLTPDAMIAQGDTTTVCAASLAAFYRRIPFIHVEAGLRTGDMAAPFPEEFHRRMISLATALHCAPTSIAAENLVREGIEKDKILISGNTVIDTLLETVASRPSTPHSFPKMRTILMTAHRRENFGTPLYNAFTAVRAFVDLVPDMAVYFPVHPNPNARKTAYEVLSGHPRIYLTDPLGYREMVAAMQNAWCILTDSGGLQEEGPALAKPVLVLRDKTERPEAIASGAVELVGTSRQGVFNALAELNRDSAKYQRMARPMFPYGDGHASARIVDALSRFLLCAKHVAGEEPEGLSQLS
jgi:UDP-N-acetylglucosamine 2-epimerase (non-hydrolysing)